MVLRPGGADTDDVGNGGGTLVPVSPQNRPDYVRFVNQDRGETHFMLVHGKDSSVESVRVRQEELTSDKSAYMEALVKSSDSKNWEVVQH